MSILFPSRRWPVVAKMAMAGRKHDRARPIGEPEIGASTTVDPRDNFPAVFATTRTIALMELAGARILHPLLQPGEMSVGAHVDVGTYRCDADRRESHRERNLSRSRRKTFRLRRGRARSRRRNRSRRAQTRHHFT